MRISDWSSDVCASDLERGLPANLEHVENLGPQDGDGRAGQRIDLAGRKIEPASFETARRGGVHQPGIAVIGQRDLRREFAELDLVRIGEEEVERYISGRGRAYIDGLLFVAEATADLDRKPGGQFIFGLTEYGDGAGADVGIALFGQGAVPVAKVEQRIEVLDMIVEIIKSENPVQRSRRRRFELKTLRQGLHPVVQRAREQARTRK